MTSAKRYRKKPITVEAFRIGQDPVPEWAQDANHFNLVHQENGLIYAEIHTLEGVMRGYFGDYVIRGAIGELYPCRADIFEDTYTTAHLEDESIYKRIVQKIYALLTTGQTDELQTILGRIYDWGKLRNDPEMTLDEINQASSRALRRILPDQ
jgi:hypothetical protein